MKIITEGLGKRFHLHWIFKDLNLTFEQGTSYAVIGANGSGKSTLLQVLSGTMPPSSGKVTYFKNEKSLHPDFFYQYISFASPFLELIEEFTLQELLEFHFRFKKTPSGLTPGDIIEKIGLTQAANLPLMFFSSGMRQRVKLALAFFSETPFLFLDEPTSNLDAQGIQWYLDEIRELLGKRLIMIASNQEYEYAFCKEKITMENKASRSS